MRQNTVSASFLGLLGARKVSKLVTEISSKNRRRNRRIPKKCMAWRFLKSVIFVFCLTFFFYQSSSFLSVFYTYPTTTNLAITRPTEFKRPAITFCNDNPYEAAVTKWQGPGSGTHIDILYSSRAPLQLWRALIGQENLTSLFCTSHQHISRSKFCEGYPHLCQIPNNLEEFCRKHTYACESNISDVLIPKLGYYSNDVREYCEQVIRLLYSNRSLTQESWEIWTWRKPLAWDDLTTTFVRRLHSIGQITCYSAHLRLTNKYELEQHNTKQKYANEIISYFEMKVEESDAFYPWRTPRIFMSIHSPFVPVHPLFEGKPLKPGYEYLINVRLEEEHLLPHPYQTDCIDYDAEWRRRNKTGPRSQEVCQDWCEWSFFGLDNTFISMMMEYSMKENPNGSKNGVSSENYETVEDCKKNCKPSCLNLKYTYTMLENRIERITMEKRVLPLDKRKSITVAVFVRDPNVIVVAHVPLYDIGNLFSFIGGLMGCWLGISVWAFAGIAEITFWRARCVLKSLKSRFGQPLRTERDFSIKRCQQQAM